MSANIYWQPTKGAQDLGVSSPSSFIEAMRATFGIMPITLTEHELPMLRAMATVQRGIGSNPFTDLADLITQHGEIKVWAEY